MNKIPEQKRLLVTGAAGFIGSAFCHYWIKNHPDQILVAYDILNYAGNLHNLNGLEDKKGFHFIQGDINDSDLVKKTMEDYGINVIVHFAAESHVDRSINDPSAFINTNIVGTHTLLKVAKSLWIDKGISHRFHHISTDEVYGSLGELDHPFTEKTPYAPNSPYAASKAASDHLVRSYNRTYGLNTVITNCSNNYGPRQYPEKLIPTIINNALLGRTIPIYGNGLNIRDWLYVDDHCNAIETVLELGKSGESYNIGGNTEISNMSIAYNVCTLLYKMVPFQTRRVYENQIKHVADRPGHDFRYSINYDKIKRELNWEPTVSLTEGLKETIKWYIENLENGEG